jgi:hypothetical protein
MRETWLRPNRRAIWFGCIPPAIVAACGGWLAFATVESSHPWLRWIGAALAIASLATIAALLTQLRKPRIAYHDGQVLFYLRRGRPIAVPVDIVEAFFLGQGPATLPGSLPRQEAVNLVARLSRRATEFARRDVKHVLGNWCDGYVTIHGTWCEPLDTEMIRWLNRRLQEVKPKTDAGR